ncbi:MAG TPA: IPT/TIG domain-containing protein [Tepidisphaeraceae bacterium]|jgi:hypothetical protein|nr:IPT/TIG domain-containing protein [Tepidisphaeraceae bacterium]
MSGHRNQGRGPLRPVRHDRRSNMMEIEKLERRVMLTLLGQQVFPLDNAWNQNISNAPVAANSGAIIAHIGASIRLHPDWGADNSANGTSPLYGIPYNVVHGNSTAKVNVIIDNYPDQSDLEPVPIPANAVIEGDYQNGPNSNGPGYNANQRGDSHLIVWDEDNNTAYELFGVSRPTDPNLFPNTNGVELPHTDGMWHAAQETVWNMNTDEFRTLGATSADAAGLSILAGLARPDEGLPVSQGGQGVIDHALRFTLPAGDINPQYIYPASHMVGTSQGADNLPMGGRLRLQNTPAIDTLINNMPPESQIVARAMQQYGLILADAGSAMFVTGVSASVDAGNNISLTWTLNDIFASNGLLALNAGDFQVVNLTPVVSSLSAASASPGSTITVNGQNFSGAAGQLKVLFGTTPANSVTALSDTQLSVVVPGGSGTVDVTVQSGQNETDNISDNPNANVNAPIFGYGTSAKTSADLFTFPSTLYITGTSGNDTISLSGTGGAMLQADVNGAITSYNPSDYSNVVIEGIGGSDTIAVQSTELPTTVIGAGIDAVNVGDSSGLQDINSPLTITDPASTYTLTLDDSSDPTPRTVVVNAVSVTGLAPAAINYASDSVSAITLNGGSGGSTFNIDSTASAATLTINGQGSSDSIALDYTSGNPLPRLVNLNGVFTLNGLSGTNNLNGTTLNLNRSTVYINYVNPMSDPLALIESYLKTGYNNGAWNGTPTATIGVITSAAAQANPNHNTAIGFADSADGQGVNTTPNTIELKYTLSGDANLDGQVNSADLQLLLASLNRAGAWDNGDFNYDGQVNSADLQALLFTLNTALGSQTPPLAVSATATIAMPPSTSSSDGDPSPRLVPAIHATGTAGPAVHHPHPSKLSARKRR